MGHIQTKYWRAPSQFPTTPAVSARQCPGVGQSARAAKGAVMKNGFRAALVAGVALNVICAVAGTASAADAPVATDAGASAVGEVIVTAERREQSVQKVPMTLQAFSGNTLAKLNVTTLDDLLRFTPNVTYGNNGPGQGEIYMRGLSSGFRGNQSSGTIANFPNVAIYLDEQ